MFSVKGIEVLGTPIGTDIYIKEYVMDNCLKIIRDTEKNDPLTDGFVHFQLMKFCVNTRTLYITANVTLPPQEHFLSAQHVHVHTVITDVILREGTWGSFRQWDKNDYDLAVTRLQMTHGDGGFGLTRLQMTHGDGGFVLTPDSQIKWLTTQIRGPHLIFSNSKENMRSS